MRKRISELDPNTGAEQAAQTVTAVPPSSQIDIEDPDELGSEDEQPFLALSTGLAADPMRDVRESMKAYAELDPMRELRESMKAFAALDPMRELRESMKAYAALDPMRELRESMKAFAALDPMRELRESMKAYAALDPMRELRESMKAFAALDPMRELRESMKAYASVDPIRQLRQGIAALAVLRVEADAVPQLEPSDDEASNIRASLSRVVEATSPSDPDTIQLLNVILTEVRSQKTTRERWILSNVLLPFVISLIVWALTKAVDPYWSQVFQRNNSSVPATQLPFIETGNDSLRSAALQEIRIVKGSHVRVRRGWRRRSPTFSSLEPGQVVLLVQKHRQNALVGFYNETQGFCGVGWVKAKYLKRVSLR